MSRVLGKIHYWLFNKIQWFEGLEEEIADISKEKGIITEQWQLELYNKYGEPTPKIPLEEIIDTDNIHGWLQERIHSAEGRQAEYITKILKEEPKNIEFLMDIYKKQGLKAGALEVVDNAIAIYKELNNYILEGMPCDRVIELIENSEEIVSWRIVEDLHGHFYDSIGGDVNNFHNLRKMWIKSFVEGTNSGYTYMTTENGDHVIERV
ncbi:hypothetical protein [Clostridium cellulovorans]|uniref:Uncharacterized protein n=1 Tax=Clostridium cellulovorans (strain ATCC 35296 / DSM 3052 / OCM 3 / 743B) TaxID=573061 RepID=D9SVD1_CLOC7|nr:hypothetical protein [Clostridium cellulovorans]ADL51055.1 hypothetical protein Clocel_1301 [Clostridium cellulovorans 743B]